MTKNVTEQGGQVGWLADLGVSAQSLALWGEQVTLATKSGWRDPDAVRATLVECRETLVAVHWMIVKLERHADFPRAIAIPTLCAIRADIEVVLWQMREVSTSAPRADIASPVGRFAWAQGEFTREVWNGRWLTVVDEGVVDAHLECLMRVVRASLTGVADVLWRADRVLGEHAGECQLETLHESSERLRAAAESCHQVAGEPAAPDTLVADTQAQDVVATVRQRVERAREHLVACVEAPRPDPAAVHRAGRAMMAQLLADTAAAAEAMITEMSVRVDSRLGVDGASKLVPVRRTLILAGAVLRLSVPTRVVGPGSQDDYDRVVGCYPVHRLASSLVDGSARLFGRQLAEAGPDELAGTLHDLAALVEAIGSMALVVASCGNEAGGRLADEALRAVVKEQLQPAARLLDEQARAAELAAGKRRRRSAWWSVWLWPGRERLGTEGRRGP